MELKVRMMAKSYIHILFSWLNVYWIAVWVNNVFNNNNTLSNTDSSLNKNDKWCWINIKAAEDLGD